MTSKALATWASVAALVTLAACRSSGGDVDDYNERMAGVLVGDVAEECALGACVTIEDDDGTSPLGVSDVGHVTSMGYVSDCRIVVRRPAGVTVVGFEAVTGGSAGEVTVLDGHLAEVVRCSSHAGHTRAVLRVDPGAYSWAVPVQGDVVIPFEDDGTTLPDRAYARAVVEGEERGYLVMGHLCLDVGPSSESTTRVCGLNVGDTFRWGTRQARIVRIVWPETPFTGWVEVAVK